MFVEKNKSPFEKKYRSIWQAIHLDGYLLILILALIAAGLFILFSASNHPKTIQYQGMHFLMALFAMLIVAQISPDTLRRLAPLIYAVAVFLLIFVLVIGHIGKGAQRWLNLGILRLQPAELMKLGIPMLLASFYHQIQLPIKFKQFLIALPIIFVPAIVTAKQPDLGTAILLTISGCSVLFLAGLSLYVIFTAIISLMVFIPFGWYFLYDYQKQRILTFLNPETDPLDSGYHIIQSKIAIGSGGLFGKGWLNGTQSNLHFLPEHTSDFIFAVAGEEFGFIGCVFMITLFMLIILRGIYISINAQDTFSRLLAGSITLTFFVSFFVNIGMVTGILPVVGIPLPLVSYGGSSMMTILISFGILMSIQTHRKLVTT